MPIPIKKSLLQENWNLAATLIIVGLIAFSFYFIALSKERIQHNSQLALIREIQDSKAHSNPEELVPRVDGEIRRLLEQEFWVGFLHHVSTAFLISLVVIVTVEIHTRRLSRRDFEEHLEALNLNVDMHMEEIKQNVWKALGKRLVGVLIATELEAIMKEPAAKEDCVYALVFKRSPQGVRDDRIVVNIETSYKLRNLSDARTGNSKFPLRCNISGYEKEGVYPRYTRFKNGQKEEKPPAADPIDSGLLKREIEMPSTADGRIDITLGMELLYQFKDSEQFITEIPIEGLTVVVVNLVPDLIAEPAVFLLHRCEEMSNPTTSTWRFDRALLPGQGFVITWNPAPRRLAASTTTTSSVLPKSLPHSDIMTQTRNPSQGGKNTGNT